jgi:hypothetical protein
MTTSSARRDYRYLTEIRVSMPSKEGAVDCVTVDASYRGVFLRTLARPRVRALVRVSVELPDGPLMVHAVVVNVIGPGEGPIEGVGLSFFALAGEAQQRWEAFIDDQYMSDLPIDLASVRPVRPSAAP